MSQDEQDRIVGRASRELKQYQKEAAAQRLEIQRIALALETLSKNLQSFNLKNGLTEDEIAALDAPRLLVLVQELGTTGKRILALEKELEPFS